MMHDDLVKRLRAAADGGRGEKCDGCLYEEDYPSCVDCLDKLHKQAADAIEEMQQLVKHYRAAYIAEHDLRIAEAKRLYDAFYEANKKAVELTPLKIVLPEPPKEETDGTPL